MDNDEVARRRSIADAAGTDFVRWSNPRSLDASWDGRAERAATYIPAGSRVLDLGCGAMALERYLAEGCTYQPCDLVARDPRTLVCDFNAGDFPVGFDCDVVSALGVLEYIADVPAFLAKVRALNCPAVLSYSATDRPGPPDRRALGWVNDYTQAEIIALYAAAGFPHYVGAPIENGQILLRLEPDSAAAQPVEDAQTAMLRLATGMIPAYSRMLGIGPDSRALKALLPVGCAYESADSVPAETTADIVVLLRSDNALVAAAGRLARPLVCAWPATGLDDPALIALGEAMKGAGFRLQCAEQVTPAVRLLKWLPEQDAAEAPAKRVLVLSYYNIANFGDRLGYHVLNSVLPADAEVTYGTLHPWSVPDRDFDLLILGIGNSLMASDALMPELSALMDRIPHRIGIFGTHFRDQFLPPERAQALDALLGKLTTWWARYEEDIFAFGRGRTNVRHLGDWLIAAFPMAVPTQDKGLTIPADILGEEVPLDRTIQRIQAYRAVSSARLHTLLCALTSADHVLYQEQRVSDDPTKESGKFRSMLIDVFGRTFDEGQLFAVDRDAVIRYKKKVEANLAALREQLAVLLGGA